MIIFDKETQKKIVWIIGGALLVFMGWLYDYNNEKAKTPAAEATEEAPAEEVSAAETTAEADKISDLVIDKRDGKTYKTVKIGTQVWMAENLAYKPNSGNYWTNSHNSNVSKYGYLYDWETAQNVCPSGWHLPNDEEWTTLTKYLEGKDVAGTKMKSTSGWKGNGNGTNESGFNGLPVGARSTNGNYNAIGYFSYWWSSTQYYTDYAWGRYLYLSSTTVYRSTNSKGVGYSVRCLRD